MISCCSAIENLQNLRANVPEFIKITKDKLQFSQL